MGMDPMCAKITAGKRVIPYVGVVTNPYFAITGATGDFEIDKVRAGTYTIEAWQERYGPVTKTITVGTTTVDFAYTGNEKPSSSSIRVLTVPSA